MLSHICRPWQPGPLVIRLQRLQGFTATAVELQEETGQQVLQAVHFLLAILVSYSIFAFQIGTLVIKNEN